MERYEKIFIWFSVTLLVIFLGALGYTALVMDIMVPSGMGVITPKAGQPLAAAVLSTPPFNHLGVRMVSPRHYEAVMFAQTWSFFPPQINVPVGSEVTFKVTSVDVTHGFYIVGTRVNMMIIPGHISETSYRFTRPGTYPLICHEYCGLLHHTMEAQVVVK
jgi:cytochrome c oxidase subunit 2